MSRSSVRTRRAWRELSHHKVRAALTVATLAAAVVGVWLFAVPRQMGDLMLDRVEQAAMHDVIVFPDGIAVDDGHLAALRDVPGVGELDVRATYFTEVRVGERVDTVLIVGVRDFADQRVNVIEIDEGGTPVADGVAYEALSDPQNARVGRPTGATGDEVSIRAGSGEFEPVTVTGVGGTVHYSYGAVEGAPVMYVPIETVWALWPWPDLASSVEFRIEDRTDAATDATIDAVRAAIADIKPTVGYNGLAEVRPSGSWPGEDDFDNFLVLFWMIVGVSLLSSFVLIATTASTLVREQTREIGIMKAIGGTRRQMIGGFALTFVLLGLAGAAVGTVLGFPLANLLIDFLSSEFIGVDNDWRFSWFALVLSLAVGVAGTLLAALPALSRVARTPVKAALDAAGLGAGFGRAGLDRALRRLGPLGGWARLGVRNTMRRKGRTVATTVQVALAIGTLLGFTALVITMVDVSEQSRQAEGGDIDVYSTGNGKRLDATGIEVIEALDGVAEVQPMASASVLVGDTDTFVWGLPVDAVFRYELDAGRWFTDDDAGRPVAVVGPALAAVRALDIGDRFTMQTRDGSVELGVIGIDSTMVGDGLAVFVPVATVLAATGQVEPSQVWLTTTSSERADIDRVAAAIRSELDRRGYGVRADVRYLEREADRATDRTIVAVIMSMGLPIVAIGMIGLASGVTTSALERRREIGVLRSIGASRRDIRRIFRAEALVIVVAGWLTGIALGYAIGRVILLAMNDAFDVEFQLLYRFWPIPVAFVIALVVAVLVLARPIGHASRLSPSDSLRYE